MVSVADAGLERLKRRQDSRMSSFGGPPGHKRYRRHQFFEKKLAAHDEAIPAMLSALRELMNPPAPKRRPIGFTADLTTKN